LINYASIHNKSRGARALDRARDLDRTLARDLDRERDRALALVFDGDLDCDLDRDLARAGDLDLDRALDLARDLDHDLDIALDHVFDRTGVFDRVCDIFVLSAYLLNWMCVIEKRVAGELCAGEALCIARTRPPSAAAKTSS
jgi:hypothetical protein